MNMRFFSMLDSMDVMYTTGTAWQLPSASLLPPILTSSFLPHWEDIWSQTCPPPPSPLPMQGSSPAQSCGGK
ncbi:hypothetical protein CesoFtcFv8_005586 [Champsocephalus esox]|uniref:Uncharacterized protein n=1 Tax=Champsocephalus esox TaxID=159716 RepID=A0AAN8CSH4_9TELE|nr:hypothetical protein CesoFtcFv8_005586 [Champsocephalus esox]